MPTSELAYDPLNDYYAVLGVSPIARPTEILRAYRAAVKRHHPDAGGDPSGRMVKAVNEAYAVLRDPAKRYYYDRLRWGRAAGRPGTATRPQPGAPDRRRPRRRRSAAVRFARRAAMVAGVALALLLIAAVTAGVKRNARGATSTDRDNSAGHGSAAPRHVSFGYATPLRPPD